MGYDSRTGRTWHVYSPPATDSEVLRSWKITVHGIFTSIASSLEGIWYRGSIDAGSDLVEKIRAELAAIPPYPREDGSFDQVGQEVIDGMMTRLTGFFSRDPKPNISEIGFLCANVFNDLVARFEHKEEKPEDPIYPNQGGMER